MAEKQEQWHTAGQIGLYGNYRTTPNSIVEGWKSSPGHNATLLDSGDDPYTKMGVGVYKDSTGYYWSIVEFDW